MRKADGGVLFRRAIWKATGMSIASAPMFLTKADIAVTARTRTKTCIWVVVAYGAIRRIATRDGQARHRGAHQKSACDDDDDIVGKTAEGFLRGHDAGRDCREGERDHEIVAEPAPDEEAHHGGDDAERQALPKGHELI